MTEREAIHLILNTNVSFKEKIRALVQFVSLLSEGIKAEDIIIRFTEPNKFIVIEPYSWGMEGHE